MAWTKLIPHYLDIPYYSNIHHKVSNDIALVGKGNYKQIQQAIKNNPNIRIGLDCSGLVCQLLNLPNPRRTNANMLTSAPLSYPIKLSEIKSGDLIRQKNGHHVILIVNKTGDSIQYIHTSRKTRKVVLGEVSLDNKEFFKEGAWRLFLFD